MNLRAVAFWSSLGAIPIGLFDVFIFKTGIAGICAVVMFSVGVWIVSCPSKGGTIGDWMDEGKVKK